MSDVLRTPGKPKREPSIGPYTPILEYEVTEDDYANAGPRGRRSSPYDCPTATAIRRKYRCYGVAIGWGYGAIYWQYQGKPTRYTVVDGGAVERYDTSGNTSPYNGRLLREG